MPRRGSQDSRKRSADNAPAQRASKRRHSHRERGESSHAIDIKLEDEVEVNAQHASPNHRGDPLNQILKKPILHASNVKPDKTKALGIGYQFPTQKVIKKIDADRPIPPPQLHKWSSADEMCKFLTC